MEKINIDNLTDEQQEKFFELFYDHIKVEIDDQDVPTPWGCPWYHGPYNITADTLEDLVDLYIEELGEYVTSSYWENYYKELGE